MASLIMSRRDLDFLLYEWLDVEALTARDRYRDHSRETFEAILDLAEQIATEHFAPHNRLSDLHEPGWSTGGSRCSPRSRRRWTRSPRRTSSAPRWTPRWAACSCPRRSFGACMAWFYAANVSTAAYPLLTVGNANLLLELGTADQVERFVRPMVEGRFFGTMALSEPQAGSSLADITTRAVPQPDGSYRLFGRKMWISGGDHELAENIVHLVLARIPGSPPGVRGISLFLVPKHLVDEDGSLGERNDVVIAGLNHKMGFRGTVNTMPNFGEGAFTPGRPAGRGRLPGRRRRTAGWPGCSR